LSTWAKGLIFYSRLTAKLFPFKFPNFKLSLLRILDLGAWHSLSLLCPSPSASQSFINVEVKAIDAHHCSGKFALQLLGLGSYRI
jgi:DNA cross-link repair 1B protein